MLTWAQGAPQAKLPERDSSYLFNFFEGYSTMSQPGPVSPIAQSIQSAPQKSPTIYFGIPKEQTRIQQNGGANVTIADSRVKRPKRT